MELLGRVCSSERGGDVFRDGDLYFIEFGASIFDEDDVVGLNTNLQPHRGQNFSSLEELIASLSRGVWFCPEGVEIDHFATVMMIKEAFEKGDDSYRTRMGIPKRASHQGRPRQPVVARISDFIGTLKALIGGRK